MGFLGNARLTRRPLLSTRLLRALGVTDHADETACQRSAAGGAGGGRMWAGVWVDMVERLAEEQQVPGNPLIGCRPGLTVARIGGGTSGDQPGDDPTRSFSSLLSSAEAASLQDGVNQDTAVIHHPLEPGVHAPSTVSSSYCLSTLGFGDVTPITPLAQMLSFAISVIGPLYLAVVMGVLIGRYAQGPADEPSLDPSDTQPPDQVGS